MATIKSYTTIEQSRKLADIIPPKSADMCWGIDSETLQYNCSPYPCAWKNYTAKQYYVPCWSLAALLDVLPDELKDGYYLTLDKECEEYCCCYEDNNGNSFIHEFSNNPVDACYEMILKLYKQKLI